MSLFSPFSREHMSLTRYSSDRWKEICRSWTFAILSRYYISNRQTDRRRPCTFKYSSSYSFLSSSWWHISDQYFWSGDCLNTRWNFNLCQSYGEIILHCAKEKSWTRKWRWSPIFIEDKSFILGHLVSYYFPQWNSKNHLFTLRGFAQIYSIKSLSFNSYDRSRQSRILESGNSQCSYEWSRLLQLCIDSH